MTASDWGPDSPEFMSAQDRISGVAEPAAASGPLIASEPFPTPEPDAGATNTAPGHTDPGTVAGERTDDLRAEIARTLVARFSPHHLDPEYRAERRGVPEPGNDSTMITFTASDGHLSMRPLTFGEVADALIDVGYRRLVSDDEATVDRVAAAMFDAYNTWVTWGQADEGDRERFRGHARAAVRALREAGQ